MDAIGLITPFLVGLLGGVHCAGMCGGIVGAVTLGLTRQGGAAGLAPIQLAYNLGRILSYTLAGAIMGGLGGFLIELAPIAKAQQTLYIFAGAFMVLLGLYLAGWWGFIAKVERFGGVLWKRLEPLGRRFLPVRHPAQALLLGMVWGWIPCGLVYSALILAITAGNATQGALILLAFGLGTLPNLLAMGFLAGLLSRYINRPEVRIGSGLLVLGLGLYALWQGLWL